MWLEYKGNVARDISENFVSLTVVHFLGITWPSVKIIPGKKL